MSAAHAPLNLDEADNRILVACESSASYLARWGRLGQLERLQQHVNGLVEELRRVPVTPPPPRPPAPPYEGVSGGL